MKLILTAAGQLASISFFPGFSRIGATHLGGQDDEGRWGSTVRLRAQAASFCRSSAKPLSRASAIDLTNAPVCRLTYTTSTMSTLPRSIGSRILVTALRPSAARAIAPQSRTYSTKPESSIEDAPAVPLKSDSTQIREEGASAGMAHAPDYNVAVDYRTSCATPQVIAHRTS